ncbi:MAG: restriction endonuclease subunit S [bacterium]|nr:restriction endonuclease subunit S [bacterium]MDE0352847.1 restriction endonuclease subunit S [bacterium]
MDRLQALGEIIEKPQAGYWGASERSGASTVAARVVRNGDAARSQTITTEKLPLRWFSPKEVARAQLHIDDTVLVSSGEVGFASRVVGLDADYPSLASNFVRRVRAADGHNPVWLAHLLQLAETKRIAERFSGGTAIHNLGSDFFGRYRVHVPPLEEQRRIGEILDTVDEAIQTTERVIAKLDTIAGALAEACISRVGTEDLVRLGDECRVLGGKRLPAGHAYSHTQTPYRYLRVVDFYRRNVDYDSLAALSEATFQALGRYEIRSGELFISIAGSIGYVGVNQPPPGMRTILTENAARIVPSKSLVPSYLALQMNSSAVRAQVRAEIGTGGGVPKLALHRVANVRVSCPDTRTQNEVAQWYESARAARDAEARRLEKLRKFRVGLAADLLSGEVRAVPA